MSSKQLSLTDIAAPPVSAAAAILEFGRTMHEEEQRCIDDGTASRRRYSVALPRALSVQIQGWLQRRKREARQCQSEIVAWRTCGELAVKLLNGQAEYFSKECRST